MNTFGVKKIKVLIDIDNLVVANDGTILNRIKNTVSSGDGDTVYERINGRCRELNNRVKTLNDIDIVKIGINYSTYCEANNITKSSLFRMGEIHIPDDKNLTKIFPINNIVILRNNGLSIDNITSLCSVDKINGEIIIPLLERTGIVSFIYSHKKVSIVGKKILQIPPTNNFGISTITI